MRRTFVVYMHTSPTGKRYIGTTYRKPEYRWGVNGKNYSANRYFWRAIQKYGWNNFKHEILYSGLSKEMACRIERELIAKYKTCDERFGYNLSTGGELSAIGCKHTQEYKENLRLSKLGPKILNMANILGIMAYRAEKKQKKSCVLLIQEKYHRQKERTYQKNVNNIYIILT